MITALVIVGMIVVLVVALVVWFIVGLMKAAGR